MKWILYGVVVSLGMSVKSRLSIDLGAAWVRCLLVAAWQWIELDVYVRLVEECV